MRTSDLNIYLHEVLFPLCTTFINFDIIKKALEVNKKYKFSYYDSQIISAALLSSSRLLITEDLNNSQKINGLTILNPFIS